MVKRFSTVTTAAASYDLTTKEAVKIDLGIEGTEQDTYLTQAVSQASAAIASYCNRVFAVERLQETFHLLDDDANFNIDSSASPLQLSRFPAVTILSVTENSIALVEGTDYQVDTDAGQILRLDSCNRLSRWFCGPVVVSYDGGYGKQGAQTSTVPTSPFQITVANASQFAIAQSVTRDDGTVFVKITGTPAAGQYSVSAAGVYTFAVANVGDVVEIRYSYTDTPLDLSMAAQRLVNMRYKGKDRDPMKISHSEPGIGEDRWWVGGFQGAAFPPEIEGLIAPYRDIPL
jgi:hypothetical protein